MAKSKVKIFLNKSLRILLLSNGMILIASAMLAPIYAIMVQEVGGDLLDASYAYAIFAAAAGITSVVSGALSDKINMKKTIMLGYFFMSMGFFAYAMADSVQDLLLTQIVIGMGEAIYSPAFDALYSKHLDKGRGASEWGAWESMNYFSVSLGAVGGGIAIKLFGFDTMFITMGVISLLSVIYLHRMPKKAV